MEEKPRFIQFVDNPYKVTFSKFGYGSVLFDGKYSTLSVDGYRKICLEVSSGKAGKVNKFVLAMGKISGSTLCVHYEHQPGAKIYCRSIEGPEIAILLYGPPNQTDEVQLWIYLMP